ncbi:MAG: G3E family GTPase [Myxococcota bacterium]|jgi:G3E family GTPase
MPGFPVRDVPTTLVTGTLGVGKTTAILDLFRHRPADGRWAVLVNEFGRVGIDGAMLGDGEIAVREVAGGCICCTAGISLKLGLVRLLREVRPDRLLIEPTGLAHPAAVLDALGAPGLRDAVSRRAVITLVDPRRSLIAPVVGDDPFTDQVAVADVLVANRCDGVAATRLTAWRREAAQLFPAKAVVATTEFGRLDPAWMDLAPSTRPERTPELAHAQHQDLRPDAPPIVAPARLEGGADGVASCGWIRPRTEVFDREALEIALQGIVRPNPGLPAGALRLKGVFRVAGRWLGVNADSDAVRWAPVAWRSDTRVEILAPTSPTPDWSAVEAAWLAARIKSG